MVALIYEIRGTTEILLYNEKKVTAGGAEYILAGNFPLGTESLNLEVKNRYLHHRCALNENVRLAGVHIILNFHPDDFPKIDMNQLAICWKFMDAIGFGDQPFLAYRHQDTQNPHIHIVTTNIQANGRRIRMHRIGLLKSDPAQRDIEQIFDLVRAKKASTIKQYVKSEGLRELDYGKTPTKLSLERTTAKLIENYSFGCLEEWNALLRTFGIKCSLLRPSANRTSPGLLYFIIDRKGVSQSVGIPASRLENRPTLSSLEEIFQQHGRRIAASIKRIRVALALYALRPEPDCRVDDVLLQQGIQLIVDNDTCPANPIFVDHLHCCTIGMSSLQQEDLGKVLQKGLQDLQVHLRKPTRKLSSKYLG